MSIGHGTEWRTDGHSRIYALSRGDKRVRKRIPIPNGLWWKATLINTSISRGPDMPKNDDTRGIRSSVGTLASPFRTLYNIWVYCLSSVSWGLPILNVQEYQSYSQFHSCSSLLEILRLDFEIFRVRLEAYDPRSPKQNRCIPGLGGLGPLYAARFTACGQAYRFRLRKPRVRLALVQILLICVFHLKSFVIVTPRYLILSTFSNTVLSRVHEAWIFFF